jgi:hypothetical protein
LAILSSGFAIYQWWSSNRQELIRAAIDASNKYIEAAINPYAVMAQRELGFINDAKIENQFARLEYVSYLANRGLLNSQYLTPFLLCDIRDMVEWKVGSRFKKPATPEAEKFIRTNSMPCPSAPSE